MKRTEDNEKDNGAPRRDAPAGGGPGSEDPLVAGSPRNLVPIAMAVILLLFAAIVFDLAAALGESGEIRDNWSIAWGIISKMRLAVFYPGVLIGLGTFAIARRGETVSAAPRVARILSWGGVVVVLLGVVEAISFLGVGQWGGWRGEAAQVAHIAATAVFEGGVLAGLALLCLRRLKGPQGA